MKYVYVVNSKEGNKSIAVVDFTDNTFIELFEDEGQEEMDTGYPSTWQKGAKERGLTYHSIDTIIAGMKRKHYQFFKSDQFVIRNIPWTDCVKKIKEVSKLITVEELQQMMDESIQ